MNKAQEQAAMEYLNRRSAAQDEKLEELREQIAELEEKQGLTLEHAEERLDRLTEGGAIERRARARGISHSEAFDQIAREAYEPWANHRRKTEEREQRRAMRELDIALGASPDPSAKPSTTPAVIETEADEAEHLRRLSEGA